MLFTLCLTVQFIKLSGGLEGGADPPAFQQAEKQRFEAAKRAEEEAAVKEAAVEELLCDTQNSDFENTLTPREVIASVQRNAHTMVSKVGILVQYVFLLSSEASRDKHDVQYS